MRQLKRLVPATLVLLAFLGGTAQAAFDVTVSSSPTANVSFAGGTYTPTATPANINVTDLTTNLATTGVTIDTASGLSGSEDGDIRVLAPVTWTSGTGLSLFTPSFAGSVEINAALTADLSNLTVQSAAMSQTAPIVMGGTTQIDLSPDPPLTLSNALNDFGSFASSAGATTVVDKDSIQLGAISVAGAGTPGLSITASGDVFQSGGGGIFVPGHTTVNAGTGTIMLAGTANGFFDGLSLSTSAGTAHVSNFGGLKLGSSNVGGDLFVDTTNTGDITQTGPVTVGGTADFDPGTTAGNDVILQDPSNNFNALVISNPNGSPSIRDVNGLVLGAVTTNGMFTLQTGGPITQSAALSVQVAELTAGSGNDITLANPANFIDDLRINSANDANVTTGNGLQLNPVLATGALTINAPDVVGGGISVTGIATFNVDDFGQVDLSAGGNNFGEIRLDGGGATVVDNNALVFGPTDLGFFLTATTGGPISQTAGSSLDVGGGSGVTLNPTGNVTLDNAANSFFSAQVGGTPQHVTLRTTGALDLGAITVPAGRNLTVNSGAGITQSGALIVGGDTTMGTSAADEVTLGNTGNDFNEIHLSGGNLTVRDLDGIQLGTTSVGGDLTVTANGAVTQSPFSPLVMGAGTFATFTAGSGAVTLSDPGNDFDTLRVSGGATSVSDLGNLTLDDSTVAGNLLVRVAKRLVLADGAAVNRTGAGSFELVTDDQAPSPPAIGADGGITIPASASLTSAGSPLEIYTARRSQNSILGTSNLNGATFTPGTEFINTASEVWNTYFPAGTATSPFTVFYKQNAPPPDTDSDGVIDSADNCPGNANPGQADLDGDGQGDACDTDDDNDGDADAADNCPTTANPGQENNDGDLQGDACDTDDDNDGDFDQADNCPTTANADQTDTDSDGPGNACDPNDDNDPVPDASDSCPTVPASTPNGCPPPDTDSDGVLDPADNCPTVANPGQADLDNDGLGDPCDTDDDNDGDADAADTCPTTVNPGQEDNDSDGLGNVCDADDDNDGDPDQADNCPTNSNPDQANTDSDAQGDACDVNDDNDGVPDDADACPTVAAATPSGCPATAPPNTVIRKAIIQKLERRATFRFIGSGGVPPFSFACKIDRKPFLPCSTIKTYTGLSFGTHTFRVRVRDTAGNVDPTPAKKTFTIPRPPRR